MSPRHRTYLLIEQGIGAGIFNVVINAAIAWLFFHGMRTVPLLGDQSIMGDTIGTTFMLPLLTAVWANLHSGYLLGVVLLGSYVVGEGVQRLFLGRVGNSLDGMAWGQIRYLAVMTAVSFLAAALNPRAAPV